MRISLEFLSFFSIRERKLKEKMLACIHLRASLLSAECYAGYFIGESKILLYLKMRRTVWHKMGGRGGA
jgi:hypothetical protein